MIKIDIMHQAANERWWSVKGITGYLSHHMYRHSPHESSDTCGNCNGALCDDCVRVSVPAGMECHVYSGTLYEWLIEEGVPEEVASAFAYSDSVGSTYKGYRLVWPTEEMLKERYYELYVNITTQDENVLQVIKSLKGQFQVFGDLREAVLKHMGVDTYDFDSHIPKQLELYWMVTCCCDHQVACG